MRSTTVFASLALVLAAPAAFAGGDGPLVGRPLPELKLSHPLQGDAWSEKDLLGSIVVLDVFQLG